MIAPTAIPAWRPLTPADLPAADRIGTQIHPNHPERPAIAAERLALDPAGCFALATPTSVVGYAITHRWRHDLAPPALDTLVGALPIPADTRHIHDLALLPEYRRAGHAAAIVAHLADHAARDHLASLTLIAVSGSDPFWRHHGFTPAPSPPPHLPPPSQATSRATPTPPS